MMGKVWAKYTKKKPENQQNDKNKKVGNSSCSGVEIVV